MNRPTFRDTEAEAAASSERTNVHAWSSAIAFGARAQSYSVWLVAQVLPPEVAQRCEGTVGGWCGRYLLQEEIPTKVEFLILHATNRLTSTNHPKPYFKQIGTTASRPCWCGFLEALEQKMVRCGALHDVLHLPAAHDTMTFSKNSTAQPPPRGSLKCAHDCNGVGNCHAGFGYCQCPAGG